MTDSHAARSPQVCLDDRDTLRDPAEEAMEEVASEAALIVTRLARLAGRVGCNHVLTEHVAAELAIDQLTSDFADSVPATRLTEVLTLVRNGWRAVRDLELAFRKGTPIRPWGDPDPEAEQRRLRRAVRLDIDGPPDLLVVSD